MNQPWPAEDLEPVTRCPACGGMQRKLLHADLTDRVFCVAPGYWSLYRCMACGSGYLDPRPTRASIGRAYAGYYTHDAVDESIVRRKGGLRSWLHDLINGYMNKRYGLNRAPARAMGRWLIPLLPPLRTAADSECRRLPPLPEGGGRVLDVGCGSGGFLSLAREAGWQVEGIDPDGEAVKTARARDLDVRHGGVELLEEFHDHYDVITLNHVIEHVHDPAALLDRLYRALKPGGLLSLETPNLDSLGANRYGRNWRGLEPPRHLTIFDAGALRGLLDKTGFKDIRQHWRGMVVFGVFAESDAIAAGSDTRSASRNGWPPLGDVFAECMEMLHPRRREFLTFTARK
jgi:2-polyprenyl-3-methyl-5-hydroxy-6-metoxy-1,4-benzoquinol methylase